MWIAYNYTEVLLGVFSTEAIAKQALLDYHGNQSDADVFGHLTECELDITAEGKCYRAPVMPVEPEANPVGNVAQLPPSANYTPAQALSVSLQRAHELEHVLIVGQYFENEGTAHRYIVSSKMDLKMALWLHRRLGCYIDEVA